MKERDGGSKERNIIAVDLNGVRGREDTINTAQDKHTHTTLHTLVVDSVCDDAVQC